MATPHLVIIGGGVAGLSAGVYAQKSGYRTTLVEHNLALGGVCTAWPRGPYTIDGCIHWLTGGPFTRLYEEVGVLPKTPLRVLDDWVTWRDARSGAEVAIGRDLDATFAAMARLAPEDAVELARMREAVGRVASVDPPLDTPEVMGVRGTLRGLWAMRDAVGALARFHAPAAAWAAERLKSEPLRRLVSRIAPGGAPAFFLLMVLGYLERGWLSRPVGGTAAFRDALVASYEALGGATRLHATVDEVIVDRDRARGVRLADGTMIDADAVVSTSSMPETVLRLLGGKYGADEVRKRMERWKTFDPIVLASFGVALPYADVPSMLLVDGIEPLDIAGHANEHLYIRVCNDDPCFAPPGHCVIQAMVGTTYEGWAKQGARYRAEKDVAAERILARLERVFPAIRSELRLVDVATPLTYWGMARSWRGAYEGWEPTAEAGFGGIDKKLRGLSGFYMAGQWVEPGGGIPMAVSSGRKVVQLLCADEDRRFVTTG